jgi:hypothetical protein
MVQRRVVSVQEPAGGADSVGMPDPAARPPIDAVRSAIARARTLGEPAAILTLGLEDAAPADAETVLTSSVRAADVVGQVGHGVYCVVLFRIGRLPAASVAERLERRIADVCGGADGSRVGMSLVAPWEQRDEHAVLRAACTDLRERRLAGAGAEPVAA